MIETTTNKMSFTVQSSAVFAFSIRFFEAANIHCYLMRDGKEIELVRGTDFNVEVKSDYSTGANITLASAGTSNLPDGLPTGATLTITRELDLKQQVSLPEYGKIPSGALERQLDKIVMICQQFKEIIARSFAVPHGMEDYDNEEIYAAFEKLVSNAETWAAQAQTGAAAASVSAVSASGNAVAASGSARAASVAENAAGSAAGSAANAAGNAMEAASEIRSISEQATLNKITLTFGEWGTEGILISYNDWTNVESITSVNDKIATHNSANNAHSDIRQLTATHNSANNAHSDIRTLISSVDNKFNNTKIRELANTRCWVSDPITPVKGTRSLVNHNLDLSADEMARAVVEVRLKCITYNSNNGYAVGDYAQWGVRNSDYYSPVQPLLSANSISCVTGNGETGIALVHKNNGSTVGATLAQWAYEFRIWY